MSKARGDQETIIRRDADGLHAWSNVPCDIKEFKEKGWSVVIEDKYGVKFTAPDHAISIRPAEKRRRQLSEKQRQALARHAFAR